MKKLKTLKDFTDKECYCWFPPFYLEDECKKKRAIPEDLIKKEAIKWVKSLEKGLDEKGYWEFELDGIKWYGEPYEGHDANGAIMILKHFFNLTEEDLK